MRDQRNEPVEHKACDRDAKVPLPGLDGLVDGRRRLRYDQDLLNAIGLNAAAVMLNRALFDYAAEHSDRP